MNDNDLNTFPVGLLWTNDTKTTRYTQQVFKFTKEIAIQTLLQMVTIVEEVSDDESSDDEEDVKEKDKIITMGEEPRGRILGVWMCSAGMSIPKIFVVNTSAVAFSSQLLRPSRRRSSRALLESSCSTARTAPFETSTSAATTS